MIKQAKLKIPKGIMFTQIFIKHPNLVEYELHLLRRIVFRYTGKSFKKCIEMRNQWLEENKS